uniref:O-acyltransferase WSD1 C-terminal domain-containing protein n=1 Tax=Magallana gigas TaxID=29159 RepID=K1Q2Y2_MAGGI
MHSLIPVHYRSGVSEFSIENNQNVYMTMQIPTNTEGAIPRLWKMKSFMKHVNHNALFSVSRFVRYVTSYTLPSALYNRLWKCIRNKCTCIISNVPGPEGPIRFGSRLIKDLVTWNPPTDDVCVSINFVSYDDQIKMAVMSDPSVLPNPELITRDFAYQPMTGQLTMSRLRLRQIGVCHVLPKVQAIVKKVLFSVVFQTLARVTCNYA